MPFHFVAAPILARIGLVTPASGNAGRADFVDRLKLNPTEMIATERRVAMSVSRPFIERPIATGLLALATLLGGILGYFALPISSLPQVDFPTVQVTTELPGASPETMSTLVTASLERQFGQIQSLASMSSTSRSAKRRCRCTNGNMPSR